MLNSSWRMAGSLLAIALLHSSLCFADMVPSPKGIVLDAQGKPVVGAFVSEQWKPETPGFLPNL